MFLQKGVCIIFEVNWWTIQQTWWQDQNVESQFTSAYRSAGHKQIFLVVEYKQPARMFKCWIVKSIYYAICWIAIYPVDSAIKHLHECPLGMLCMGVAQDLLVVSSFKYWLHSPDCLLPLNAKMLQAITKVVLTISWSGFPIPRAWVWAWVYSCHSIFPNLHEILEHLCCNSRVIFYTCVT